MHMRTNPTCLKTLKFSEIQVVSTATGQQNGKFQSHELTLRVLRISRNVDHVDLQSLGKPVNAVSFQTAQKAYCCSSSSTSLSKFVFKPPRPSVVETALSPDRIGLSMDKASKDKAKDDRVTQPVPEAASPHERLSISSKINTILDQLPSNTIGALWILLAAFLFTIMTTLIKLVGGQMSIFQLLAVRQGVMVLIVAPQILRGLPSSLSTKRPDLQVVRILFATTAMLCGFTAVVELPLADVTALSFSKTFFLTIFAIIFLGETVGAHRWVATIVGFLGVLLMLNPGGGGFVNTYALLAIAGSASAGMVMIILRKLTKTDAPVTILTYQAVFVGLLMAIPAYLAWQTPTVEQWILMVLIGVVSWAAQLSNIKAFRAGEATAIASLDYSRLIYATLIGIFVFNQWPGPETLFGAAIIIAASLYTVRREAIKGRELARAAEGRGYNN